MLFRSNVTEAEIERELGSGYGIFRGRKLRHAVLRFAPDAARWVSAEVWHPQQESTWLADGRLELKLPYSESPELEMDILRHGELVEVVKPEALREKIASRLAQAASGYQRAADPS